MKVLTIFSRLEKIHLEKDVFLLPKEIAKICNSTLHVICKREISQSIINGVTFEKHGSVKIGLLYLDVIFKLLHNSKNYDLLFLTHLRYYNFIYLMIYRIINPKGKVYVKMDHGEIQISDAGVFYGNKYKIFFEQWLYKIVRKKINLISCETPESLESLSREIDHENIILIENGISDELQDAIKSMQMQRENRFLFVGRLNDENKNIDFLFEALKYAKLNSWTVEIIGDYDGETEGKFNKFIDENANLEGKVKLIGPVFNRLDLMAKMRCSRCLILCSRHEGSPLVFSESVASGMFILSTRVSGAAHYCLCDENIIEQGKPMDMGIQITKITSNYLGCIDRYERDVANKFKDMSWKFRAERVINNLK